jgi:hypothetical protein
MTTARRWRRVAEVMLAWVLLVVVAGAGVWWTSRDNGQRRGEAERRRGEEKEQRRQEERARKREELITALADPDVEVRRLEPVMHLSAVVLIS